MAGLTYHIATVPGGDEFLDLIVADVVAQLCTHHLRLAVVALLCRLGRG